MKPEILLVQDRATHFLHETVLNPAIAQRLAPLPTIVDDPIAEQQKQETFAKTIQQISDFDFTTGEVNSLLKSILKGFARGSVGWNRYAIRASLEILPFIGLKKLYPAQMAADYIEATFSIPPKQIGVSSDISFEALIQAGMILIPHMSTVARKKTGSEVIPALREELKKRHSDLDIETYEDLVRKVDNLENSFNTGIAKPVEVRKKDTTEFANRFNEFSQDLWYKRLSQEQLARLDSLVNEAIINFGLTSTQIVEMSGMTLYTIRGSIRRLKESGFIPDKSVTDSSLSLQVQELMGKGLTQAQIAHILGPGITEAMVRYAMKKLQERAIQEPNQPKKKAFTENNIINLVLQGLSNSQIVDRLDIPLGQVNSLIKRLRREGKIQRRERRGRNNLNHTNFQRDNS